MQYCLKDLKHTRRGTQPQPQPMPIPPLGSRFRALGSPLLTEPHWFLLAMSSFQGSFVRQHLREKEEQLLL